MNDSCSNIVSLHPDLESDYKNPSCLKFNLKRFSEMVLALYSYVYPSYTYRSILS